MTQTEASLKKNPLPQTKEYNNIGKLQYYLYVHYTGHSLDLTIPLRHNTALRADLHTGVADCCTDFIRN